MLATVVHLLETTLIRVGNDEYAEQNKSYGLTTLKNRHVAVNRNEVRFRFTGKGRRFRFSGKAEAHFVSVDSDMTVFERRGP